VDESAVAQLSRSETFEELGRRRFDLLVIGGGIIGAGIAWQAARAGLAVALVDRSDFGSQTSSASSKLVHGGLRYLRLGDVRLVREAHRERRALVQIIAPHLVRRLPFLLPLYDRGPYRPGAVQAGLWLYSTLARERLGRLVPPDRARRSVPSLRTDGLHACGTYADAWTHDSRLCLAAVTGAAEAGAVVANYVEVTALRIAAARVAGAEVEDRIGDGRTSVSARAVVNATGPWVDSVRRLEDPRAASAGRLSKGVHVFVEPEEPWSAALVIPHDKVRVSFAVPWEGLLLLGTTDTVYEGGPDDADVTEAEVAQVLAEAAVALEPDAVARGRIRSTSAGLRVLPGAGGATVRLRRETVLLRGRHGMLSVAGGKLTTFRRIALDALAALRPDLGLRRLDTAPAPLPGAAGLAEATARLARERPDLDPSLRAHLLHLYGSRASDVLAVADRDPALLEPLRAGGPDIAAQAVYAYEREWACSDDDVLQRRTTVGPRGLAAEQRQAGDDEHGPDDARRAEPLAEDDRGTGGRDHDARLAHGGDRRGRGELERRENEGVGAEHREPRERR
jgi:glycerol-3-phosphate dehydrogenase